MNECREIMMANGVEGNGNNILFGSAMGYGLVAPVKAAVAETVLPMYGSAPAVKECVMARNVASMKCDSGLTCAVPDSKKRSRDASGCGVPSIPSFRGFVQNHIGNYSYGSSTFLGEDMAFQIQQQQSEIGRLVSHHTDKLRTEIEERGKRYSRRIAAAVQENMMKKMKARDAEIQKIVKMNLTLEEKVKALIIENQIWRDLAHTNEATANGLRSNLEQIIAQRHRTNEAAFWDDAQSCCGSNDGGINRRPFVEISSTDGPDGEQINIRDRKIEPNGNKNGRNTLCRSCGKEESCVLLLPCRHLCLCTICGTSLHVCPVCNSTKTASVHVNLCG